MTTPCYYCERPEDHCKSCIHSDTYEEPKQTKPLSDEEIREICKEVDVCFDGVDTYRFARAIEERHGIK